MSSRTHTIRKYTYHPDESIITSYIVYAFFTESPKLGKDKICLTPKKQPSHVAIRVFHNNGYSDFETGNENYGGSIHETKDIIMHTDSKYSWTGCILKKEVLKKKYKLEDLRDFTFTWNSIFRSQNSTQYPYNCRGYVDSVLYCFFGIDRIYTEKQKGFTNLCDEIKDNPITRDNERLPRNKYEEELYISDIDKYIKLRDEEDEKNL